MSGLVRRAGAAGLLTVALVVAGCGGGDDGGPAAAPGTAGVPSPGPAGGTGGAGGAAPAPGGSGTTSGPAGGQNPSGPAGGSGGTAPAPTPTPVLLHPVQMPDGRTAPEIADFSFRNLKLDQRFLGTTIATVDVTYTGPGWANAAFTAVTSYTDEHGLRQKVDLQGMITRIASGATTNVRLSGASNLPPRIRPGYSATYQVTSVADADPAARTE